jgi:hypothetical protein
MAALLPGIGCACSGKGGLAVVLSTIALLGLRLSVAKAAHPTKRCGAAEHRGISA